jgi:hypothetical protein
MATRAATLTHRNDGRLVILWEGLVDTTSDVGSGVLLPRCGTITVQVVGDFGTDGTIVMQGSPDDTTYGACHVGFTTTDTAIGNSEPTLLAERPIFLRPSVTAASGTTDLDVYVVLDLLGV